MKLSDVQTMDGVTLDEGGTYYGTAMHPDEYLVILAYEKPYFYNGQTHVRLLGLGLHGGKVAPIHHGTAIGLWASRETLEAGLGKGAEAIPVPDTETLLDKAKRIVSDEGKASVSTLQRRLSLGYSQARRLVEEMKASGYVDGDLKYTGLGKGKA